MTNILLVHGAWHGAWCWYRMIPALAARGITAHTLDLPGHGLRAAETQSLAAYGEAVAEKLRSFDAPVALLGHSLGGQVIAAACELAPEKIDIAIHLAGFLPRDGETILEQAGGDDEAILAGHMQPQPDGRVTVADDGLIPTFYADCPADDVALARLMLVPQSGEPFAAPVTQTPNRADRVRRAYIVCAHDKALGPKKQFEWAARAGVTPVVLDTSHSPFFSAPDTLAGVIESVV